MKKLLIVFVSLMFATLTFAADYNVTILNKTGLDLYQVYISDEESDDWEEDILDEDEILAADDYVDIELTDYESPLFDVRAVDENGAEYMIYGVNVQKKREVVIQLSDLAD